MAYVGSGGCRVELSVCRACLPEVSGNRITVPRSLVLLDVYAGLLGESIAGFFLGLVEPRDEWVTGMVERYRFRVVAEELYSLVVDTGGLVSEARVSPLYGPARRASLLGEPYAGFYASSEDRVAGEYERIARRAGLTSGGRVRPRLVRGALERARIRARIVMSRIGLRIGRMARRLMETLSPYLTALRCTGGWTYDSRRYVSLPEGEYWESPGRQVLAELLGDEYQCSSPGVLSSSSICRSAGDRRVVLKRYASRGAKWVPASLASPSGARFTVRAPARMAREYRMLRVLRSVVPTPGIIAVIRHSEGPMMVRDFVPGTPVLSSKDPEHWRGAGMALAFIHRAGYAMLDSNPGNFLVGDDGRTWVIDAEQAHRFTPEAGAWDLLVFAVYSLLFGADKGLVIEAFRAYREADEDLFAELRERALSPEISGRLMMVAYPLYHGARLLLLSV